ncbi:HET-domain-containing protein [Apiospora marii]|uniref:HET-domain-containing protein n=1 Tax=Apiospora marii TaxID=335849 RepID=A0ABR1R237_9PEZI
MASLPGFLYTPLEDPENCLRLLQLHPAECHKQDLHATLSVFRREAAPPYRPVSYTWGTEKASSQLMIQNHRQQTDNNEKGHQVRTMDRIYRDKHVFVWLGDSSENSADAMDLIDWFCTFCEASGWSPGSPEAQDALTDYDLSTVPQSSWKAIYDIISRPWFTRRWIVQEFVLSGAKDFWIGFRHQTFQPLLTLILFLKETPLYLGEDEKDTNICNLDPDRPHPLPSPEIDAIDRLERLWSAYLSWQTGDVSGCTLEHLLDKFSGFASYDPRDGIYAFVSMASDIAPSEWFPDYSDQNTPISIYKKATLHIMSHGSSLDIIGRHAHNFEAMISADYRSGWIPWFGPQATDFTPILYENCQEVQQYDQRGPAQSPQHIHLLHGYNTRSFTTFGQFLQRLTPDHEGWMGPKTVPTPISAIGPHNPNGTVPMKFAGLIVDKIIHMRPGFETQIIHEPEGWFYKLVVDFSPESPGMENHINDDGSLDDTMLRVMTGSRRVSGGVVCHATDSWIAKARQMCRPRNSSTKVEDERSHIPVEESRISDEVAKSMSFMFSNQRRVAFTENSVGIVPLAAQEGDHIAMVSGCSVPLVLRWLGKAEDLEFRVVIGECYIEGLMEGEIFERSGEHLELETLTLM